MANILRVRRGKPRLGSFRDRPLSLLAGLPHRKEDDTESVTIRAVAPADAAAVAGLIRVMAEQFEEETPVTAEWVAEFIGDDACFAVVAELDGDLVGVVTWTLVRGLFHAKKSAIIAEASVTPAEQNRGIGRALLEAAIASIREQDVAEISIGTGFENERAKHLYRSLGFVEETLLLEQHL